MTYFSPARRGDIIRVIHETGRYSGTFRNRKFVLTRIPHAIVVSVCVNRVWQQSTAPTVFDALMTIEGAGRRAA